MSGNELIQATIAEHTVTVEKFRATCVPVIESMAEQCIEAVQRGNKVCFFGNGGSAADAQHFAAEFVVRYTRNRVGLPAIALTTDSSILTACGNDYGFEAIFARQIEALCVPGDVVFGISTSGNSRNVVRGIEMAKEKGITSFAFTGEGGGQCAELADLVLEVPSTVTARVQECHLIAGHLICDLAEIAFAEEASAIS